VNVCVGVGEDVGVLAKLLLNVVLERHCHVVVLVLSVMHVLLSFSPQVSLGCE